MTWQRGDKIIQVGGTEISLRLTMGALAELDARLGVSGPEELADKFRNMTEADARQILTCLLTDQALTGDVLMMSEADLTQALSTMCALFEEAFT